MLTWFLITGGSEWACSPGRHPSWTRRDSLPPLFLVLGERQRYRSSYTAYYGTKLQTDDRESQRWRFLLKNDFLYASPGLVYPSRIDCHFCFQWITWWSAPSRGCSVTWARRTQSTGKKEAPWMWVTEGLEAHMLPSELRHWSTHQKWFLIIKTFWIDSSFIV